MLEIAGGILLAGVIWLAFCGVVGSISESWTKHDRKVVGWCLLTVVFFLALALALALA